MLEFIRKMGNQLLVSDICTLANKVGTCLVITTLFISDEFGHVIFYITRRRVHHGVLRLPRKLSYMRYSSNGSNGSFSLSTSLIEGSELSRKRFWDFCIVHFEFHQRTRFRRATFGGVAIPV